MKKYSTVSVIITFKGFWKRYKAETEEALVKFSKRVKEELPNAQVHIIEHLNPSPPEGSKPRGKLWCPYCAGWRKFKPWYRYKRCEVCLISDAEFYVRKHNKLFMKGGGK